MNRISTCAALVVVGAAIVFSSSRNTTAQGPPAKTRDIIVVDQNGAMLGKVVGVESPSFTFVAVASNENWLLVRIEGRDTIEGAGHFAVSFNSADCTGQAFVAIDEGLLFSAFLVTAFGPNKQLYAETGPVRSIAFFSQLNQDGSCSEILGGVHAAVPAAAAADLSRFTPPFRVVMR